MALTHHNCALNAIHTTAVRMDAIVTKQRRVWKDQQTAALFSEWTSCHVVPPQQGITRGIKWWWSAIASSNTLPI